VGALDDQGRPLAVPPAPGKTGVAAYAIDQGAAERLWTETANLLKH
jgi:hypothetical protein